MKPRMRIAGAVIAVAGLVAAGGGVALASPGTPTAATRAATSAGPATSSQLTWHPLHLINGWKAMSSADYGAPSYALQDGVLYLSGILAAPRSVTGPEFAVLPAGARPKHFLWLLYYNFGGSGSGMVGNMEIQPDGDMFIYGPESGPVLDPALQAISFPVSS